MQRIVISNPNGWWPKVSPKGDYIAYGNNQIFILDLATTKEVNLGMGYIMGWLDDSTLYASIPTNEQPGVDIRKLYALTKSSGWAKVEIPTTGNSACGNDVFCSKGHWGTCIKVAEGGRFHYDGNPISFPVQSYGMAMDGVYVASQKVDYQANWPPVLYEMVDGVPHTLATGIGNTTWYEVHNGFLCGGMPNYIVGPNNVVTPIGLEKGSDKFGEGPPFTIQDPAGDLWLWSFIWGDMGMWTVGRKFKDPTNVIILPGFIGLTLSIVARANDFVIAGHSDVGQANYCVVPYATPMTKWVPPEKKQEQVPVPDSTPSLGARWVGCYKDFGHVLPGNCWFEEASGKVISWPKGDTIVSMVPDSDSRDWLTPNGNHWVGIYGYVNAPGPDTIEGAYQEAKRICETGLAALPPNQPCIILCQMYDRNLTWKNEATLAGLMKAYPEVAAADSRVKMLLYFSGPDRKGGTGDHPSLIPWYQAACGAVTGDGEIDRLVEIPIPPKPPIPPVPPTPPTPPQKSGNPRKSVLQKILYFLGIWR